MNSAALAAALVDRGLDPAERLAKASLFERALERFSKQIRSDDEIHAWWVPGRLEVFGTHTDYAGGRTMVCAVPRGFAVVARARRDGVLHVVDARRDQDVTLSASDVERFLQSSSTGWRRYVAVVLGRLAGNFADAPLGGPTALGS